MSIEKEKILDNIEKVAMKQMKELRELMDTPKDPARDKQAKKIIAEVIRLLITAGIVDDSDKTKSPETHLEAGRIIVSLIKKTAVPPAPTHPPTHTRVPLPGTPELPFSPPVTPKPPFPKDSYIEQFTREVMGHYDASKRFLLSSGFRKITGRKYEADQVRYFDREQIVAEVYFYIATYFATNFPPYLPFGAVSVKELKVEIRDAGDLQTKHLSLNEVAEDLGLNQLSDRFGALDLIMKQAADRQSSRVEFGSLDEHLKRGINTYTIQSMFSNKVEQRGETIPLRATGVSVGNGTLFRVAMTSMILRGDFADYDDGQFSKDTPSPFSHEADKRPKMLKANGQIKKLLANHIKTANAAEIIRLGGGRAGKDKFKEKYGEEPTDEQLDNITSFIVYEMMAFGDITLMRAIHDIEASRYDEMEAATLLRYRATSEKALQKGTGGAVESRQGATPIEEEILMFYERLWIPEMARRRYKPIFLYRDVDDAIRVGTLEATYKSVIADDRIKDETVLDLKTLVDESSLSVEAKKKILKGKIAVPTGIVGSITVPAYDKGIIPQDRGVFVESLSDLIQTNHPANHNNYEANVLRNANTVKKLLEDWDFDPSRLVSKVKKGGKAVTFNRSEANKISKMMRSAWYYWLNDSMTTRNMTKAEYITFKDNYTEPTRKSDEEDAEFAIRHENWEREWAWRGIPLQVAKRDNEGILQLEDDGSTTIEYHEYQVNHMFNFHLEGRLNKMVRAGQITKDFRAFSMNMFARVMDLGEVSDKDVKVSQKDQFGTLTRVLMETAIIHKLIKFREEDGHWDKEHTDSFLEMLSSVVFESNRSGVRGVMLRKRYGALGVTNKGSSRSEKFHGVGGWTRDEGLNVLKTVFSHFEIFGRPESK